MRFPRFPIPAAIFDALQASAEQYGGVGAHLSYAVDGPCCLLGHACNVDGSAPNDTRSWATDLMTRPAYKALVATGFTARENDRVVDDWKRTLTPRDRQYINRMPWAEYVAAIGLVRA